MTTPAPEEPSEAAPPATEHGGDVPVSSTGVALVGVFLPWAVAYVYIEVLDAPAGPTLMVALLAVGVIVVLATRLAVRGRWSLRVGADGLELVRPASENRFVSWEEVDDVIERGFSARLALRTGDELLLSRWMRGQASRGQDLLARARESLARHRRAPPPPEQAERVRPAARAAEAWREQIERLGEEDAYRDPTLSRDVLFQIVESPRSDEEARVGAAAALALRATEDERGRLASAAAPLASSRARLALEALAEERLPVAEVLARTLRLGKTEA